MLSETWSDYDGEMIYGDYEVVGGSAVEGQSYQAGIGTVEPWTSAGQASTTSYHVDMLGSTRGTSVFQKGAGSYDLAYTAFGEPVLGTPDRYGFAGAWGYQSHDTFDAMHVGARYYDPTIGRFLQRDPSGIRGGMNVYSYALNIPTVAVDPDGEIIFFLVAVGIAILVLDSTAQYANPPAPGDTTFAGSPGPSPASLYGLGLTGLGLGLGGRATRPVPYDLGPPPSEPDRPPFDDMWPGHRRDPDGPDSGPPTEGPGRPLPNIPFPKAPRRKVAQSCGA